MDLQVVRTKRGTLSATIDDRSDAIEILISGDVLDVGLVKDAVLLLSGCPDVFRLRMPMPGVFSMTGRDNVSLSL